MAIDAVPMNDGRREYGDATRDIEAQEEVPMGPPPGHDAVQATPLRQPGDAGPFNRGTELPEVPVTDGSPVGPGRGPEALRFTPAHALERQHMQMNETLRGLAMRTGDPYIIRLLDRLES